VAVRRATAAQHAAALGPLLDELSGHCPSYREIALKLNERGLRSPTGGHWYPEQVRRTKRQAGAARVA
jgi:hypothetical protein